MFFLFVLFLLKSIYSLILFPFFSYRWFFISFYQTLFLLVHQVSNQVLPPLRSWSWFHLCPIPRLSWCPCSGRPLIPVLGQGHTLSTRRQDSWGYGRASPLFLLPVPVCLPAWWVKWWDNQEPTHGRWRTAESVSGYWGGGHQIIESEEQGSANHKAK